MGVLQIILHIKTQCTILICQMILTVNIRPITFYLTKYILLDNFLIRQFVRVQCPLSLEYIFFRISRILFIILFVFQKKSVCTKSYAKISDLG